MIAAWMLYCSLCAAGLAAAAALAERVLVGGRGAVRPVWVAAIALSLTVPAAAFFVARNTVVVAQPVVTAADIPASPPLDAPPVVRGPRVQARHVGPSLPSVLEKLNRYDTPLATLWVMLAGVVALQFLGGLIALATMRRHWERRTLLGVPVLVSDRTGPAVIGALSPAIVLPEWALALSPDQLTLMLRHEQEHQRAGDARLLTIAHLALVVMPWNLALWWQVVRLRVAIELDCDARVLRGANARSYGDLLLEVARPRRSPRLVGAIAFAERATQLERRIRVLGRHRAPTPRAARALAGVLGLLAVTAASVAPHPAPRIAAVKIVAQPPVAAVPRGAVKASAPSLSAPTPPARPAAHATAAPPSRTAAACEGSPADGVFHLLFNGLTLSNDRQTAACELLTTLYMQQLAEDAKAGQRAQMAQVKWSVLQTVRDISLRALLTNDADRAKLDARLAQMPTGGRGWSGGAVAGGWAYRRGASFDTLVLTNRVGRGRGGVPSSAAAPAGTNDSIVTLVYRGLAGSTFERLFEGIALTPEQESAARALIAKAQSDAESPPAAPLALHLRVNVNTGAVFMRESSASALTELLSSDADRQALRSRVVAVP